MARIINKNGCEDQNRLECIEGIEIDLLNGQKALIYPKYSNEELLDPKDRDRWLDAGISETRALRLRDNQAAKREALRRGLSRNSAPKGSADSDCRPCWRRWR